MKQVEVIWSEVRWDELRWTEMLFVGDEVRRDEMNGFPSCKLWLSQTEKSRWQLKGGANKEHIPDPIEFNLIISPGLQWLTAVQ